MKGGVLRMFHEDIKQLAKENPYFRHVIFTGAHSQLVLMCLKRGEDIGTETHPSTDQMLFVVEGQGEATIGGETFDFDEHDVVVVPAGTVHNIKNKGDELKLYTIYSSPEHIHGTIHKTKADAMKEEEE